MVLSKRLLNRSIAIDQKGSGCADHPINIDRLKPSSKQHEVTALPHQPRDRRRASPHAAEGKCYPASRDGGFDARQAQPPR